MLVPEPPRQSEADEYGDYPAVLRGVRTSIQTYNAIIIPNIKASARNQEAVVEKHNQKIDELNKNCDRLWEIYNSEVLKLKKNKKKLGKLF